MRQQEPLLSLVQRHQEALRHAEALGVHPAALDRLRLAQALEVPLGEATRYCALWRLAKQIERASLLKG